jgi:hypothetical protein
MALCHQYGNDDATRGLVHRRANHWSKARAKRAGARTTYHGGTICMAHILEDLCQKHGQNLLLPLVQGEWLQSVAEPAIWQAMAFATSKFLYFA